MQDCHVLQQHEPQRLLGGSFCAMNGRGWEGSNQGLFRDTNPEFIWRNCRRSGKASFFIVGVMADTQLLIPFKRIKSLANLIT